MPLALFYGWSSTSSELPNTCTINQQPPLEVLHKPAWVYWRRPQNCLQWRPDRGTAGVDSSSTMIRWTTIDCPERLHAIREISQGCKSWALDRSEQVTNRSMEHMNYYKYTYCVSGHSIQMMHWHKTMISILFNVSEMSKCQRHLKSQRYTAPHCAQPPECFDLVCARLTAFWLVAESRSPRTRKSFRKSLCASKC